MKGKKDVNKNVDNKVFYLSLIITLPICLWAVISNESLSKVVEGAFNFFTSNFSWLYLLAMLIFVIFAIWLAFSKYGNIKLGPDDSEPAFKRSSWFAMLFGAGMGIGLVFWGAAEPISHFLSPRDGIQPATVEAANFAMKSSFLHWGIHPWAGYSIIGLSLAYFQFRKGKSGLISNLFEPLLGEKVKGPIGTIIDTLAAFATIAGIATSLGLGTLQINSGLNYLFGIPNNILSQVIIIAVTTVIFIWTAVSGIDKGMKILSDINLLTAGILAIVALLIGPTLEIVNTFVSSLGSYTQNIMFDSLNVSAYGDNSWLSSWTVFYWAWWIAWAPFVGTFIARISRGRTIREFILGVMVAPALASFVFFSIFGTLGIDLFMGGTVDIVGLQDIASNVSLTLFKVLSHYKLGFVISLIVIFLLFTFFITSANSATFVLGMFTSNGDLNPSNKRKITLGLLQSLLAVSLLTAGGLNALQTSSLLAAFPFVFIMFFAMVSLVKALKSEKVSNGESEEEVN
ncbi:BCCT family transporter [Terrisporobacter glycolicus]|nr:BCCT family transporter [Terrisporobacter glycolicus]